MIKYKPPHHTNVKTARTGMEQWTLEDWTNAIWHTFQHNDRKREMCHMWGSVVYYSSKIAEGLRKAAYDEVFTGMAHTFVWIASFVAKLNKDEDLQSRRPIFVPKRQKRRKGATPEALGEIILYKYPNKCIYCKRSPCICTLYRRELEELKDKKVRRDTLIKERDNFERESRGTCYRWNLNEWVGMFERIYGDTVRSLPAEIIGFHLAEEVGECMKAIRGLMHKEGLHSTLTVFQDTLSQRDGLDTLEGVKKFAHYLGCGDIEKGKLWEKFDEELAFWARRQPPEELLCTVAKTFLCGHSGESGHDANAKASIIRELEKRKESLGGPDRLPSNELVLDAQDELRIEIADSFSWLCSLFLKIRYILEGLQQPTDKITAIDKPVKDLYIFGRSQLGDGTRKEVRGLASKGNFGAGTKVMEKPLQFTDLLWHRFCIRIERRHTDWQFRCDDCGESPCKCPLFLVEHVDINKLPANGGGLTVNERQEVSPQSSRNRTKSRSATSERGSTS